MALYKLKEADLKSHDAYKIVDDAIAHARQINGDVEGGTASLLLAGYYLKRSKITEMSPVEATAFAFEEVQARVIERILGIAYQRSAEVGDIAHTLKSIESEMSDQIRTDISDMVLNGAEHEEFFGLFLGDLWREEIENNDWINNASLTEEELEAGPPDEVFKIFPTIASSICQSAFERLRVAATEGLLVVTNDVKSAVNNVLTRIYPVAIAPVQIKSASIGNLMLGHWSTSRPLADVDYDKINSWAVSPAMAAMADKFIAIYRGGKGSLFQIESDEEE
ncbi:hypothetical protein [Xanthomonas axonopodis]